MGPRAQHTGNFSLSPRRRSGGGVRGTALGPAPAALRFPLSAFQCPRSLSRGLVVLWSFACPRPPSDQSYTSAPSEPSRAGGCRVCEISMFLWSLAPNAFGVGELGIRSFSRLPSSIFYLLSSRRWSRSPVVLWSAVRLFPPSAFRFAEPYPPSRTFTIHQHKTFQNVPVDKPHTRVSRAFLRTLDSQPSA